MHFEVLVYELATSIARSLRTKASGIRPLWHWKMEEGAEPSGSTFNLPMENNSISFIFKTCLTFLSLNFWKPIMIAQIIQDGLNWIYKQRLCWAGEEKHRGHDILIGQKNHIWRGQRCGRHSSREIWTNLQLLCIQRGHLVSWCYRLPSGQGWPSIE